MTTSEQNELYFEAYTLPSMEEAEIILDQSIDYSNIRKLFQDLTFLFQENNRDLISGLHMGFSGENGRAKKEAASLIAALFHHYGEIKKDQMIAVSVMDLMGGTREETVRLTQRCCEEAADSLLYIDDTQLLINHPTEGAHHDLRRACIRTLITEMTEGKHPFLVIFSGRAEDLHYLLEKDHPEILPLLYQIVEFPDLTPEECVEVFEEYCSQDQLTLSAEAKARLYMIFASLVNSSVWGNQRLVRDKYLEMKQQFYQRRTEDEHEIDATLIPVEDLDQIQEELKDIVGMDAVKEQLEKTVDTYLIAREQNLKQVSNNHMLFLGNPGTGKTSMLGYYADLLIRNGIAKSLDQFVVMEAIEMLAQANPIEYMLAKMREAQNGFFVLDDLDQLFNDSFNSQLAFSMIMKLMEEGRDTLTIILSGRKEKLERLLQSVPGLPVLLTHVITFPDYSIEELQKILLSLCSRSQITVTDSGMKQFTELICELQKSSNYENARTVRMIFEHACRKHVENMKMHSEKESSMTLDAEDFVLPDYVRSCARSVKIGFGKER